MMPQISVGAVEAECTPADEDACAIAPELLRSRSQSLYQRADKVLAKRTQLDGYVNLFCASTFG